MLSSASHLEMLSQVRDLQLLTLILTIEDIDILIGIVRTVYAVGWTLSSHPLPSHPVVVFVNTAAIQPMPFTTFHQKRT